MLTSDKVDFRRKNMTREKEEDHITINSSTPQGNT